MSATINPDIVTDGLVLCFDAGNNDCFRGEPTTNLITGSFVDGMGHSTVISSNEIDQYGVIRSLRKATINNTNGTNRVFISSSIGIPVLNRDYTISMWIKRVGDISVTAGWEPEVGPGDGYLRPNIESGYIGTYGASPQPNTVPTEWTYITYSFKYTVTTTTNLSLLFYINGNVGAQILFSDPQVETKSYATPYVNGTRGGTVATGGGLFDLSNNNNHGTIVRNAVPTASFYNSGNRGNLIFDGVNDYVALNNKDGLGDNFSSFSIDLVIRTRTGTGANEVGYILHRSTSYTVGTAVYSIYMATDSLGFSVNGSNFLILNNKNNVLAHYCYTWDGSVTKLYTNGVFTTSVNFTTFTNIRTGSTATIGSTSISPGYRPANCDLFNLKIYDEALTPKQILDNYRATKGRYGL